MSNMCTQAVFMKYAVLLCRGLSNGAFSDEESLLGCSVKPNIDALARTSALGIVRIGTPLASGLMYELLCQGTGIRDEYPFVVCDSGETLFGSDVCIRCSVASVIRGDEEQVSVCRADLTDKQLDRICSYLSPLISDDIFRLVCAGGELCLIWRGGDVRGCSFSELADEPVDMKSFMPHGDISAPFCALIERSIDLLSDYGDYALWPEKSSSSPVIRPAAESLGHSAALCGNDKAVRGLCRAADMEIYSNAALALDTYADVLFFDIDLTEDADSRLGWLDSKLLPRLLARTGNILILPAAGGADGLCPPMPFLMHRADTKGIGSGFDEASCRGTGLFVPDARELMDLFTTIPFE